MNKYQLKALLKSAWALDENIKTAEERIAVARAKAERDTPHYGPHAGGGGDGKRLENDVINLVDAERPLLEMKYKREAMLRKVIRYIELLPPSPMQVVLYKRYINYHPWEQIATELHYSWQHVHRLHAKALDTLLQRINRKNIKNPSQEQQSLFPNEEE